MVGGINGNNSVNWYQLLNSLKTSSQGNLQSGSGSSGITDTANISSRALSGAGRRKDPLEQLVDAGTITSDQATAIHSAFQSAMEAGQGPDSGSDPLAGLVSAGTITQDQADSVKSTLDANKPGQKSQNFMSSVLDNLVSSGTISKDQEDSIKQTLSQRRQGAQPPPPPPPQSTSDVSSTSSSSSSGSSSSSSDLSTLSTDEILQLLAAGKISTQQAEAALKKLEGEASGSSSVSGASSSTSSGSSVAASGSSRSDPLDSLVSSGVITQDQEKAVRSAFQQAMDARRANAAYSSAEAAQYGAGMSI